MADRNVYDIVRVGEARRFTSGEKLVRMLRLTKFNVGICRYFGLGYPTCALFYDSQRPSALISAGSVFGSRRPVGVFRVGSSEPQRTTIYSPEEFDENIDGSILLTFDLSGLMGDGSVQVDGMHSWTEACLFKDGKLSHVDVGDSYVLGRFDENVSAKDFIGDGAMSAFTKKYYDKRKQLIGGANRNSKLVNCVYDKGKDYVTFVFKTFATPDGTKKQTTGGGSGIVPSQSLMDNPSEIYFQMIRILDFVALLKDTRPDSLADKKITWADVKEVVGVADVQMWCGCPAFYFQGIDYWLSQLDGSVYPCNIKPKVWNSPKLHGEANAFVCKHLASLWNSIGFFANPMTSMINKVLKESGTI